MTPPAIAKAANRKAQRTLSKLVLLLAILAVASTILATLSGDVVIQVLSQTELVQAENSNSNNNNSNSNSNYRKVIVHEPYGYDYHKDDSGKTGFFRYLSRACFYEYRLPRAFLEVSQHREKLTLEESKEILFMADMRKRPWGWEPSPKRNVFLDEPYRDMSVDRLFKWSHLKILTSLLVGLLSLLGLVVLSERILRGDNATKQTPAATTTTTMTTITKVCAPCLIRPRALALQVASLPVWNELRKNTMVSIAALAIPIGLAGVMPASAIIMLLDNNRFCGKRCASSSLDPSIVLEVEACIERCFVGRRGKLAIAASCLWLLVLLLVLAVAAISVMVTNAPSATTSSSLLSRWWWWNNVCLPLAIRPEQLYHPPLIPLPLSHQERRQQ